MDKRKRGGGREEESGRRREGEGLNQIICTILSCILLYFVVQYSIGGVRTQGTHDRISNRNPWTDKTWTLRQDGSLGSSW